MSYKIAFLDDAEFEQLPGKDMHDKIGVAYPKYGEAYVRKTGSSVIDTFTLAHELEHLDGATHGENYDPENECYYKGGFMSSIMPIALPILASFLMPGVGTALGGMLGGAGSSLGGAASGLGQMFSGALGHLPGIGGALSGAANTIGSGIGSAASGVGSQLSRAGSAFANAGAGAQRSLGITGGASSAAPLGGGATATQSMTSGLSPSVGSTFGSSAMAPFSGGGTYGAGVGGGANAGIIGASGTGAASSAPSFLERAGQLGSALGTAQQGASALGIGQQAPQTQAPTNDSFDFGNMQQQQQGPQDPAISRPGGSSMAPFDIGPLADPFAQFGGYAGGRQNG